MKTRPTYSADGHFEDMTAEGFDAAELTEAEASSLDSDCRAVLAPASREELVQTIGVLGALLKSRDGGDFDRQTVIAGYSRELGDLAGFAVKEACRHIARGAVFFPTLAEIRREAIKREAPFRVTLRALRKPVDPIPELQEFSRPLKNAPTPIAEAFYRSNPDLRGKLLKYWPDDLRAEFIGKCRERYGAA